MFYRIIYISTNVVICLTYPNPTYPYPYLNPPYPILQELYWTIKGLAKMGVRWADFPSATTSLVPSPSTSPSATEGVSTEGDNTAAADGEVVVKPPLCMPQHHHHHPVAVALATAVEKQVTLSCITTLSIYYHEYLKQTTNRLILPDTHQTVLFPSFAFPIWHFCHCPSPISPPLLFPSLIQPPPLPFPNIPSPRYFSLFLVISLLISYHRAIYDVNYDNFHDIYLQRWRKEDVPW